MHTQLFLKEVGIGNTDLFVLIALSHFEMLYSQVLLCKSFKIKNPKCKSLFNSFDKTCLPVETQYMAHTNVSITVGQQRS